MVIDSLVAVFFFNFCFEHLQMGMKFNRTNLRDSKKFPIAKCSTFLRFMRAIKRAKLLLLSPMGLPTSPMSISEEQKTNARKLSLVFC
jgi:hypothetical protein